jgi:hypothetical protein
MYRRIDLIYSVYVYLFTLFKKKLTLILASEKILYTTVFIEFKIFHIKV